MSFPRLPAFVGDIEFEKTAELFGEVEAPEIILSGQQTVEHDITHRGIGRSRYNADRSCVNLALQRSVLHEIIFYIGVDGAGIRSFAAVLRIIFLRIISVADADAQICMTRITQVRRNGILDDIVIAVVETLVVGIKIVGTRFENGIQQKGTADIPSRTQVPFLAATGSGIRRSAGPWRYSGYC